jgi:hypothetical protein
MYKSRCNHLASLPELLRGAYEVDADLQRSKFLVPRSRFTNPVATSSPSTVQPGSRATPTHSNFSQTVTDQEFFRFHSLRLPVPARECPWMPKLIVPCPLPKIMHL